MEVGEWPKKHGRICKNGRIWMEDEGWKKKHGKRMEEEGWKKGWKKDV